MSFRSSKRPMLVLWAGILLYSCSRTLALSTENRRPAAPRGQVFSRTGFCSARSLFVAQGGMLLVERRYRILKRDSWKRDCSIWTRTQEDSQSSSCLFSPGNLPLWPINALLFFLPRSFRLIDCSRPRDWQDLSLYLLRLLEDHLQF
jgi:hypothetical protein